MYLKNKLNNMPSATEAWKEFVDKTDVVENVCRYLDDMYYFLKDEESSDREKFKEVAGKLGSAEWKDFQYLVIQNLKHSGAFSWDEDDDVFHNDFEDSAGCEEIVQGEAFDVLHKLLDIK
jgi:hypothetical protein